MRQRRVQDHSRRHTPRRRTSVERAFLRRPSTAGGVVEGGISADEGVVGQIHLEHDEAITLPSDALRDEERSTPIEIPPSKPPSPQDAAAEDNDNA